MKKASKLTGDIVHPNDPLYPLARRDFNLAFNKFPCAIVYCESVQDVINAVLWKRKNKVPLRIRNGGHSFEAFSLVNKGLIIDVSKLNGIHLDKSSCLACVGAGNKLLPLYTALWEHGVTIPGGTCPSVGITGLTLGGGFGMLTRKYGMLCDNLVGVEMVDANGRVIYADEDTNPDLLWATRGGGGGNFGVVTSLLFEVHPISDVTIFNITWDWDKAKEVIKIWQNWAPFVDENLTSIIRLYTKEDGRIVSSGEFLGSKCQLAKLIEPLIKSTCPTEIDICTVPYIEAVNTFGGIGELARKWKIPQSKPFKFKHTGAFVYKNLPLQAIDTMLCFMANAPNPANSIEFQALGGAVKCVGPSETAYFHRRANFNLHYKAQWEEACEEKSNIKWVENLRKAMCKYTVGDYVNFPDTCIKNWPIQYYGKNLNRLQKIKCKYDPNNCFKFPQSIPLLNAKKGFFSRR